jgi:hypothetical protein
MPKWELLVKRKQLTLENMLLSKAMTPSLLFEKTLLAVARFYEHNDLLVFLVPLLLLTLLLLIIKPNRRKVLFLLGVALLLLQFEYTQVIFKEVKTDWLNQIFAPDFRFRQYHFATFFFQELVPLVLGALGWMSLALAALI